MSRKKPKDQHGRGDRQGCSGAAKSTGVRQVGPVSSEASNVARQFQNSTRLHGALLGKEERPESTESSVSDPAHGQLQRNGVKRVRRPRERRGDHGNTRSVQSDRVSVQVLMQGTRGRHQAIGYSVERQVAVPNQHGIAKKIGFLLKTGLKGPFRSVRYRPL